MKKAKEKLNALLYLSGFVWCIAFIITQITTDDIFIKIRNYSLYIFMFIALLHLIAYALIKKHQPK